MNQNKGHEKNMLLKEHACLNLNGKDIEGVHQFKLLDFIISGDLEWVEHAL